MIDPLTPTERRREALKHAAFLEKKADPARLNARHAGTKGEPRHEKALDKADAYEDEAQRLRQSQPDPVNGCPRCGEATDLYFADTDHVCHPEAIVNPQAAFGGTRGTSTATHHQEGK